MPATVQCACCNRSFEPLAMVKCCICRKQFKNSCVDLSTNEVRILNANNKGWDWSCISCRQYGNDIKDLKAVILDLQNAIIELKSAKSDSSSQLPDNTFEEIIAEVSERNKRKSNLIIFGVPEQDESLTANMRTTKDKESVLEILQTVNRNVHIDECKPVRLGKRMGGKTRPIKVTLNNEESVTAFIKYSKNLKNSQYNKKVFISTDRTPRQRAYYNKIREQLKERVDAGETNLKIKHLNSVPSIVAEN